MKKYTIFKNNNAFHHSNKRTYLTMADFEFNYFKHFLLSTVQFILGELHPQFYT